MTSARQVTQLTLELGDAPQQAPAVDFELGLARAPRPDSARLLAEGLAPPPKPRQAVAQQGQLDLGPPLLGVGVLGEDVEDDRRAVDRRAPEQLLQVATLGRTD